MAEARLKSIKIILVEPEGELNVGSIARIMKNMGLQQLVLVNPQCDPRSEMAQQMAVHAQEILQQAQIVRDLPTALAGCKRAIATTARDRALPTNLEHPQAALPWLLEPEMNTGLIFGPESRGLSNTELNYAQRFVKITASPDYPSLNLATAVAICAYELYQISQSNLQNLFSQPNSTFAQNFLRLATNSSYDSLQEKTSPNSTEPKEEAKASLDEVEASLTHLEQMLLKIGYLYPHTAAARMQKFRRMFNRAGLTSEELTMLRGIMRQVNWAVEHLNRQS